MSSSPSPSGASGTRAAPPGAYPRWFWPCFVAGLVACALPFVLAPILPMCDINGHAGMVGALLQRGHPGSRVDEYFAFNVHASPNAFYWGLVLALGKVLPMRVASNLFVIVFCVVGPPLCYLFALRMLGRPPALAFLALAAVFHRSLWFGFIDSVAADGFLFLELGFLERAFTRRRWSWWDAGLAGTLLLIALAHAFMFLVAVGLWLLFAVLAWRQPSPAYRRFVVGLPALAYLLPWLLSTFGSGGGHAGRPGGPGLLTELWRQREPARTYLKNVHQWFLNGYTSSVDEILAIVFAITLVAALIAGARTPARPVGTPPPPVPDRLWGSRYALAAGGLAAGYLLLPMSIRQPFGWWAANVRLLVPFLLMLGLLVPLRPRGLPSWAFAPLGIAAALYGLYVAQDFRRWWVGVELRGFDEAIHSIPVGQRVHAIYPVFEQERHYSHFPMGHIVDWYVVDRGGTAAPWITSHPKEVWTPPRLRLSSPWGVHTKFVWAYYAPYWDYFLVKQPAPGNGAPYVPFPDAPAGAVTRVFESGLWSVWKRTE